MINPLDLAAQVALILHTLGEYPDGEEVSDRLYDLLSLAGLRDIQSLLEIKGQGFSVFGEMPAYAIADAESVREQVQSITELIDSLPTIEAPSGEPIPDTAGAIAPVFAAVDWSIADAAE